MKKRYTEQAKISISNMSVIHVLNSLSVKILKCLIFDTKYLLNAMFVLVNIIKNLTVICICSKNFSVQKLTKRENLCHFMNIPQPQQVLLSGQVSISTP